MNPGTTCLCVLCLTSTCCTPLKSDALIGSAAAAQAAHAFRQTQNRWPQDKADLEVGAATAGVKLLPGDVVLAPQPDGRLRLRFRAADYVAGGPLLGVMAEDTSVMYLAPSSPDMLITRE